MFFLIWHLEFGRGQVLLSRGRLFFNKGSLFENKTEMLEKKNEKKLLQKGFCCIFATKLGSIIWNELKESDRWRRVWIRHR